MIYRLLLILILLPLSSCVRLKEFPIESEFDGIKTALDRNASVNILITHGLGGFTGGDPNHLIHSMAAYLGLLPSGPGLTREIVDGCKTFGSLKRCDFIAPCGKNVFVYALDWSDSTKNEKLRLKWMDQKGARDRLPFINKIKKTLVNNDLPDAIFYLSHYKPVIEHPVIQSIRWIEEDSSDNSENIVIGLSMGGLIVVNALDTMMQEHDDDAKRFIDQLAGVFFLSNSYPLLELGELKPKRYCSLHCWDWRESPLGRFVYTKRETLPDFQIVSLNDPNDIVSYWAIGYPVPYQNGCLEAFLNQNVRNAKRAIFGFINPFTAHLGYGRNKNVHSMVILGTTE